MRGGAQAFLMEVADGHHYVVKFADNPQHRRVLVNELVASAILAHLEIAQPETRLIELTSDFLAEYPEVHIQLGNSRRAVTPGWHFGSRFPGNPLTQAVYDILPDALMPKVANLADFRGVLAVDKWTGNADSRQAIFFRARLAGHLSPPPDNPLLVGYVAQMIDHGYLFDGPNWGFPDAPLFGLYFRPSVYRGITGVADFEPWLSRIAAFPESVLDRALASVPAAWLPGDDAARLSGLLEQLLRRRKQVARLIEDCTRARVNPFPDWK